jgi:rare lipoprotein A
MEKTQVAKLKLNVTNIRSVLISSNKEILKIKQQKNNLTKVEENREKTLTKEKKIESPLSGLKSSVNKIKNFALQGPMGIFDKIKEFLGLVILGILVNNLPKILEEIEKISSKIGAFLNSDFIKGLGMIFSSMFNFFGSIADGLGKISLDSASTIQKEFQDVDNLIDKSSKEYDKENSELESYLSDLNKQKPPPPSPQPAGSSQRSPQQATPAPLPRTPAGRPGTPSAGPGTPQGAPTPKVEKYSRGGTVKSSGTTSGPQKKAIPQTRKVTTGVGESGKAKKARQSVNYFATFNEAVKDASENAFMNEQNNKLFEDMVNNFKQFSISIRQASPETTPTSPTGEEFTPGEAIEVDPDEVIGLVGHTGRVVPEGPGGTHIHIEKVGGGPIASDIKNNIYISGLPMPQRLRFTSGIGWRWGRMHRGEDYAGEPNQPITLRGGLKFLRYEPDNGSGYGNRVFIQAPDGTSYSLSHLNGGPKNIKKLKEKQQQQQQNPPNGYAVTKVRSGKASYYADRFHGRKTAYGERFNMNDLTAASPPAEMGGLPYNTMVRVTNTANGKSVVVRINDTGPYAVDSRGEAIYPLRRHPTRIIDLSKGAMKKLGGTGSGVINIKLEVLEKNKAATPPPAPVLPKPPNIGPVRDKRTAILPLNKSGENNSVILAMIQPVEKAVSVPVPIPVNQQTKTSSYKVPSLSPLWG